MALSQIKKESYAEAWARGIIPEEKKPYYEEAVRRGLIEGYTIESLGEYGAASHRSFSKSAEPAKEVSKAERAREAEIIPDPVGAIGGAVKTAVTDPMSVVAAGAGALKGALVEKAVPYVAAGVAKGFGGPTTERMSYRELVKMAKEEGIGSSKELQKQYPKSFLAGEVAGGFGGPLGAALGPMAGRGLKGTLGAGAIGGGVTGAAYAERPGEIGGAVTLGGVAGAAIDAALYGTLKGFGKAGKVFLGRVNKKVAKANEIGKQVKTARREMNKQQISERLLELNDEGLSYGDIVDPRSTVIKEMPNRIWEKATINKIDKYSNILNESAEKSKTEMLDMISKNQIGEREASMVLGETMSNLISTKKRMLSAKARPLYKSSFTKEAGTQLLPADVDANYIREVFRDASAQKKELHLTTFLRAKGGIRESEFFRGELRARDVNSKMMVALRNETTGMDLDEAALQAWENGYIPGDERPTVNEFLEYLDDDIVTKNVKPHPDFDDGGAGEENALLIADTLGIPASSMKTITTSEIDQYLKKVKPKYSIPVEDPILSRPIIKEAIKEARDNAELKEDIFVDISGLPDNSLAVLHEAKQLLFKKSKNFSSQDRLSYEFLYDELSKKMNKASPDYKKATEVWKDDTAVIQELYKQKGIGNIAKLYDTGQHDLLERSIKNVFKDSVKPHEIERMRRNLNEEKFSDILRKDLNVIIGEADDSGNSLTKSLFGKTDGERSLRGKRLDLLFSPEQKRGLKKMTGAIDRAKTFEKRVSTVSFKSGGLLPTSVPTGGKYSAVGQALNSILKAVTDSPARREAFVDLLTSEEGRAILEKAAKASPDRLGQIAAGLSRVIVMGAAEVIK